MFRYIIGNINNDHFQNNYFFFIIGASNKKQMRKDHMKLSILKPQTDFILKTKNSSENITIQGILKRIKHYRYVVSDTNTPYSIYHTYNYICEKGTVVDIIFKKKFYEFTLPDIRNIYLSIITVFNESIKSKYVQYIANITNLYNYNNMYNIYKCIYAYYIISIYLSKIINKIKNTYINDFQSIIKIL